MEHPGAPVNRHGSGFGSLELNLQYKFLPDSRLQPYLKGGLGVFFLGQAGVIFSGGGLTGALGADYFVSPHVGLGVELQFKGIEYGRRSQEINGQKFETELNPKLEGKSSGILLTLTVQ